MSSKGPECGCPRHEGSDLEGHLYLGGGGGSLQGDCPWMIVQLSPPHIYLPQPALPPLIVFKWCLSLSGPVWEVSVLCVGPVTSALRVLCVLGGKGASASRSCPEIVWGCNSPRLYSAEAPFLWTSPLTPLSSLDTQEPQHGGVSSTRAPP